MGDKVVQKKAFARKNQNLFVGCSNHRFNLAVKDVIIAEELFLSRVFKIMLKLCSLLLSAKLNKYTHVSVSYRLCNLAEAAIVCKSS